MPPTERPYEWSVLRVVPRVERGEFVNVGVVVYCQTLDFLAARISDELGRVLGLDPATDVVALRHHLDGVAAVCAGASDGGPLARRPLGERFRWLVAPRSTVVQAAPVHTGLTVDAGTELADLYVRMVAGR